METDVELLSKLELASNLNLEGKHAQAAAMFAELVALGSSYAAVQLGYMHQIGQAMEIDKLKAEELFKLSKVRGSDLGQYFLGLLYLDAERFEEAFREIRELAELGYLPAVNRLGEMYELGIGCVVDLSYAKHYRTHAASHGHLYAMRWRATQLIKSRRILSILRGVVQYLKVSLTIFWFALKRPADPRVQA